MESFSGSVLVLTRQKLIQKATVAHCSGSPRFVLVTAEMIKKHVSPFFREKIFLLWAEWKNFLWYVSFLYEYFGTTENNNLIVFINVYFLSTVIILQKIQFFIYSRSTLDWDKNNLFLRFSIFIFDKENFLFSAGFVKLQEFPLTNFRFSAWAEFTD